jgi:hypothetical protein
MDNGQIGHGWRGGKGEGKERGGIAQSVEEHKDNQSLLQLLSSFSCFMYCSSFSLLFPRFIHKFSIYLIKFFINSKITNFQLQNKITILLNSLNYRKCFPLKTTI